MFSAVRPLLPCSQSKPCGVKLTALPFLFWMWGPRCHRSAAVSVNQDLNSERTAHVSAAVFCSSAGWLCSEAAGLKPTEPKLFLTISDCFLLFPTWLAVLQCLQSLSHLLESIQVFIVLTVQKNLLGVWKQTRNSAKTQKISCYISNSECLSKPVGPDSLYSRHIKLSKRWAKKLSACKTPRLHFLQESEVCSL